MKIVIVGAGEVGSHLARMLSGTGHDITVVDSNAKQLEGVSEVSDVVTIEGDPATFTTLKKASMRKTDLLLAVHQEENINILSAVLGKRLGAKKTIARIDNNEFLEPANREVFTGMGIDYMFYPEKTAAREVIDVLDHTATTEYVDFSGGRMSLVVFRLSPTSPLVGRTMLEIAPDPGALYYRIVAIERGGETIIPHGDDRALVGDTAYVITSADHAGRVQELSGRSMVDVKNIMILGGSRIGVQIARALQDRVNIKLVEYQSEEAYRLAEILDKTLIINADGRNIDAMMEEGINRMDAFIAVTSRSETNILTAMLAKKMGVKKVIAEVENLNYITLAESIGIDTVINKKLLTASNIFRFTMNTDVQAVKCLTGTDAEVLEFVVKPNSPATRVPVRELGFPSEATIGGVVRNDRVLMVVGDTEIVAYDRVVVLTKPEAKTLVGKFFN
ncbi:MAG: Trk system potassium transporter TrkA [Alistipes sp.]|jgi:trk system potassium uptake protein TrkA|nr:Trk system potassium transporter TrkA [Alistipes sp.]